MNASRTAVFLGLCLGILFVCGAIKAAVTIPSGFVTLTITPGAGEKFVGLGLSKPAVFQANTQISGSVSQLVFISGSFPAGSYARYNVTVDGAPRQFATHCVEILDGSAAGSSDGLITHIHNDGGTPANTVLLSESIGFTSGAITARIRPFLTIGEVFVRPSGATSWFVNGDTLDIYLGASSPLASLVFDEAAGKWEWATGEDASDLPIPIDAGMVLTRVGAGEISFKLLGEVKTGPTTVAIKPGVNYYQNVYPLAMKRLKDLNLYTGDANTGLKAGTNITNADVLTIEDRVTGVKNQFFVDQNNGRFRTGFTDASLMQIPENATFSITRSGTLPNFNWSCPEPVMALGEGPLPLNLVAVASRKTHGASQFDVNLPIGGAAIEPRAGGNVTVVYTFSGASASQPITSGSVSVSAPFGGVLSSIDYSGDELRANLTGVSVIQTVTLAISNVATSTGTFTGPTTVALGILMGDVSNNRVVNVGDSVLAQQGSQTGLAGFGNFRADIDSNGEITASDVESVKTQSGEGL